MDSSSTKIGSPRYATQNVTVQSIKKNAMQRVAMIKEKSGSITITKELIFVFFHKDMKLRYAI